MSSHFFGESQSYVFRTIAADTNGYLAVNYGGPSLISTNGQFWRPKTASDPEINEYDFAFSTPPYARAINVPPGGSGSQFSAITQISSNGLDWQSLSTPRGTRRVAALGDIIAASDGYRLVVSTNRSTWTTIATNVGWFVDAGGSSEFTPYYEFWITGIHAGHGMIVASTLFGELLWTTNGFDWKTNNTNFQHIEDFAFTPHGLLLTSGRLIAEAYFKDLTPPPKQEPAFAIRENQIYFEGPLRHHEIQSSLDLQDWSTIQTTATNATIQLTTEPSQFFRALQPD